MKKCGRVLINKAITAPHSILPFHFNKNYPSLPYNYFYFSQSGSGSSGGSQRPDEEIGRDTERRVSDEKEMSELEESSAEQGMADGARDAKADFVDNDPGSNSGGGGPTSNKGKETGYQQLDNE